MYKKERVFENIYRGKLDLRGSKLVRILHKKHMIIFHNTKPSLTKKKKTVVNPFHILLIRKLLEVSN